MYEKKYVNFKIIISIYLNYNLYLYKLNYVFIEIIMIWVGLGSKKIIVKN